MKREMIDTKRLLTHCCLQSHQHREDRLGDVRARAEQDVLATRAVYPQSLCAQGMLRLLHSGQESRPASEGLVTWIWLAWS